MTISHVPDLLRGSSTLQDPTEPIAALHQRLENHPEDSSTLKWLSYWFREQEHYQKAGEYAKRSLSLAPNQLDASILLAANILSWNRHAHQLVQALLKEALGTDPGNAAALTWFGWASLAAGNPSEALALFERSAQVDNTYPETRIGRYSALKELDRESEALADLYHAYDLWPCNHLVLMTLARFHRRKQPEVAQQWYERAVALRPWKSNSRFSFGTFLLSQGDFERGWGEYEHFRNIPPFDLNNKPALNRPLWDGRVIDKTLLIYAEQGQGDTIQLARYLPWAAARASRLLLACRPSLHTLFSRLPIGCECHSQDDLPKHDCWAAMFSLPRLLGATLTTIPGVPYLSATQSLIDKWTTRLGKGYKVGLVWAGAPYQVNDENRSMKLDLLAPLFHVEGARFFSLQVGERAQDIEKLGLMSQIVDLSPGIHDFHDTAAIINALDLIVTVDTSVAHLAGALAARVWLMLYHKSEWRWLYEREDSPWYPTMRIFRQPRPNDWEAVVAEVANELLGVVSSSSRSGQKAIRRQGIHNQTHRCQRHSTAEPL